MYQEYWEWLMFIVMIPGAAGQSRTYFSVYKFWNMFYIT